MTKTSIKIVPEDIPNEDIANEDIPDEDIADETEALADEADSIKTTLESEANKPPPKTDQAQKDKNKKWQKLNERLDRIEVLLTQKEFTPPKHKPKVILPPSPNPPPKLSHKLQAIADRKAKRTKTK